MATRKRTVWEGRLPSSVLPFSIMLDDLGNPPAAVIARTFRVTEATVKRWIKTDNPPLPVLYATFWLTSWGRMVVNADAENAARVHASLHNSLLRQNRALIQRIELLESMGQFGTANSPFFQTWAA